jgi:hypothetical protein
MEISFKFPFYFDTFNKLSATLRSGQESQVPNKEFQISNFNQALLIIAYCKGFNSTLSGLELFLQR